MNHFKILSTKLPCYKNGKFDPEKIDDTIGY